MKKFIIISCITCALIMGVWLFNSDKTIEPNSLISSDCNVNKKTITFKIDILNAAIVIKNYSLEQKNNSLYIKFKGNVFTSNKNMIRNITIKNEFKNIENIYLTDGSTNQKIWSDPLKIQE
ncbi:MAG: hypothetical protein K0R18_1624 [Bacillales bacterium]|jgi:hypothetical protein|nr:hypothetical protein [Bacillales bacterium]